MLPDMDDGVAVDAEWWRKAAQATIRRYCGWHVAPVIEETLHVTGRGGHVLLIPSKRIISVSKVVCDGTDLTDEVDWDEGGIMRIDHGAAWPDRLRGVEVTLTHGWAPEEAPDVLMLRETIARRARSQPGVSSQSVDGASASYFTAGGAPLSVPLLDIEKKMLDPYRLNWGLLG